MKPSIALSRGMDQQQAEAIIAAGASYLYYLLNGDVQKATRIALANNQIDLYDLTPPELRPAVVQYATELAGETSTNITSVLERMANQWAYCTRCGTFSKRLAYWEDRPDFLYPPHICGGCSVEIGLNAMTPKERAT